jgi:hypothetical protein
VKATLHEIEASIAIQNEGDPRRSPWRKFSNMGLNWYVEV